MLAEEELQKSQKRYMKYYYKKTKPRCLEVGEQVLILLQTDNKLSMYCRGPYIVESRVEANDYRITMGSKTKTYYMNMLKKYIAREHDDVTIGVARVIYQDTDPELGGSTKTRKKGFEMSNLGEDLPED